MGESFELDEAYEQANQPVLQMRRSLYILAGVLAYFLAYHFILASAHSLLYILMEAVVDENNALEWISRYLMMSNFIGSLIPGAIYFFEKRTVTFLENMKITPKNTVILLVLIVVIAVANTSLMAVPMFNLSHNLPLRDDLLHYITYFDYSFSFLMGLGFIFIYSKYYKKQKNNTVYFMNYIYLTLIYLIIGKGEKYIVDTESFFRNQSINPIIKNIKPAAHEKFNPFKLNTFGLPNLIFSGE